MRSRTPLDEFVIENRDCPYCGAYSGEVCRIADGFAGAGRAAVWTHEARVGDLRTVFLIGYYQGEQQGMQTEHAQHIDGGCWVEWRKSRGTYSREAAS